MPQPMGWVEGHPLPSGGGGPPDPGLPVDGMGNLEEAEEDDIDPNMLDVLEWTEENGAYGYPNSDDEEDEEEEGGQGGGEPAVRSSTRGNRGVPPTHYHDGFELVADIMSPPIVAMALDGEKGDK